MPRARKQNPEAARRIYAIGDIHGTLPPLCQLHRLIDEEEKKRKDGGGTLVIYMGDYIDRGPDSRQVVDYLLDEAARKPCVFLKGNHEQALLQFLERPQQVAEWLKWGGLETLTSYGIDALEAMSRPAALPALAAQLTKALPPAHLQFYRDLKLMHEEGDYVFVHAGLRAGRAIGKQTEQDMLTIREEFLETDYDFGKQIVFGHTIFKAPYHKNGRIGVDTGGYMTGRLTCAVLETKQVRFLTTTPV